MYIVITIYIKLFEQTEKTFMEDRQPVLLTFDVMIQKADLVLVFTG